jgi:ubiquinone/menaquinone biosynthesis C-methylase UbiE
LEQQYALERIKHWNKIAASKKASFFSEAYHKRLFSIFRFLIPKGSKVIELGCGNGDLLAYLEPSEGVGVDFSPEMIDLATHTHTHLKFLVMDVHNLSHLNLNPPPFVDIIIHA